MSNTRLLRYYLAALEKFEQGLSSPLSISRDDEVSYQVLRIVPRRADAAEWPLFEPSELGQWALRIGNGVLISRDDSLPFAEGWRVAQRSLAGSAVLRTRALAGVTDWSPDEVTIRQQHLAEIAVQVWPRFDS